MTKQIVAALAAGLSVLSASAGLAQQKPAAHKFVEHKPAAKPAVKTAASAVYVCKECKEYFPAAVAKKINYKDSMGHPLTKMAKAPAGFVDGSTAKM